MSKQTLVAGAASGVLSGDVVCPGDKSMSHRAVMLAALADGVSEIKGFLPGEDNLATAAMFEQMGVSMTWLNDEKTHLRIDGVGLHGLKEPEMVLDAGNSGTCFRLMTGVLAGQSFFTVMTGDTSLCSRPMFRVVEPLRRMGAHLDGRDHAHLPPLMIRGGQLQGMYYRPEIASAQVKSCVLFAALYAEGETQIQEPRPTRDHTERMMPLFGQPVMHTENGDIIIRPTGALMAPEDVVRIPSDPSSAAFFAVAASLIAGSEIRFSGLGINPRRDGWRRILMQMGAELTVCAEDLLGNEPVADMRLRAGTLRGIHIDSSDVPDAIDEFPVLFAAAALAQGDFVLESAKELRVKESDRIATMAAALNACGAQVEEQPDGVHIRGCDHLTGGVTVDACGDHRIAMAMSVAAQRAASEIRILHAGAIATSFPSFVSTAQSVGMNVYWEEGS